AKPGSITFGTAGVGSATHISAEILRFSAAFEALQVPFRGMPEILTEIMAGRVDFSCSTIATALPFIREGKLVALAVSTPQRSSALPDVPTTIEAGYKNSDYTFWTGLFVPAKTPREIVDKLAQETQKALPRRVCGRNSRSKAWTRCRSRPLPSMRRSGGKSIQFSPWPKRRT